MGLFGLMLMSSCAVFKEDPAYLVPAIMNAAAYGFGNHLENRRFERILKHMDKELEDEKYKQK
ncbi:MAG: hypothetical protein KAU95_00790 [Candidatus Aenigmarchaeota archaeon]|nr:hypothetical protein [Candidatus Aenigmarchaeota archaeon]